MLIFMDEEKENNVLYVMIGPESELSFDLKGSVSGDISEPIRKLSNAKKPIILNITRVNSEQQANIRISQYTAQKELQKKIENGEIPFPFPFNNGIQKGKGTDSIKNEINISNEQWENGLFVEHLKCPKCGGFGVFLKKGEEPKCSICAQIDNENTKRKRSVSKKSKIRKDTNGNKKEQS